MTNPVLHSRKDESAKDFISRISQMSRAFDKKVDGIYDGAYIADIKPSDNPEEVYASYERARAMAMKQYFAD